MEVDGDREVFDVVEVARRFLQPLDRLLDHSRIGSSFRGTEPGASKVNYPTRFPEEHP